MLKEKPVKAEKKNEWIIDDFWNVKLYENQEINELVEYRIKRLAGYVFIDRVDIMRRDEEWSLLNVGLKPAEPHWEIYARHENGKIEILKIKVSDNRILDVKKYSFPLP